LANGPNSNDIFQDVSDTADNENDLFISDNVVEGYSGTYYTQSDSAVRVHGTDFGIKPSLENGWVNQNEGEEALTLYMNCASQVSVVGRVSGESSTGETVLTLPPGYEAKESSSGHSAAIQTDTVGSSTAGDTFPARIAGAFLNIDKLGQDASRVSIMFTYQSDGRLW